MPEFTLGALQIQQTSKLLNYAAAFGTILANGKRNLLAQYLKVARQTYLPLIWLHFRVASVELFRIVAGWIYNHSIQRPLVAASCLSGVKLLGDCC